MIKVIDNKILHDTEKLGWIEGSHIKNAAGVKVGHIEGEYIYNEQEHKVAYIHENELVFENGSHPVPAQTINEEIAGTLPLLMKCAIYIFFEE